MIRVSVIIPSFNRAALLGATLDSLRNQTFNEWEVIVVDDESTDDSIKIAHRYRDIDTRIQVLSRKGSQKGANICRNQGLAAAVGEYIIFLDSDDLLLPDCLEYRVLEMDRTPQNDFIVYQTELFKQTIGDLGVLWNAYTKETDLIRFLDFDGVWLTTGPIWRKPILKRLGGFDEQLSSFQDWDLHVRALIAGSKYDKIPRRDNFHRHEYDKTNSITAIMSNRPDHLSSHEYLFLKIHSQLYTAGLLNRNLSNYIVGLFWWLAESWLRNGNSSSAKQVWRLPFTLGLCNRFHYLEGRLIISFLAARRRGRTARMIQRCWPKAYYLHSSEHFNKAPVL